MGKTGEEVVLETFHAVFGHQGHHRSAEPCPRELGPVGSGPQGFFHQGVQFREAYPIVLGEGAMALHHEFAEGPGIPSS